MKKYSVLAGSSYWVPGSWVLNFEKNSQLDPKMGTSQQPEPKLGVRTGPRTRTDPKTNCIQFLVLHFFELNFKLKSFFFPACLTEVRYVINLRKKSGLFFQ
jgi:hypothetical protein